jgi:hypothetical protein
MLSFCFFENLEWRLPQASLFVSAQIVEKKHSTLKFHYHDNILLIWSSHNNI